MDAPITSSAFRAAGPAAQTLLRLGPLKELPGTWVGTGFNLVALPNGQNNNQPLPFRLKLNNTMENLSFTKIGGPIPNRGSSQIDIFFLGLHYLQQVSDAASSQLMHIEPGLWLNLPASQSPAENPSLARLGTIPHGDSLLSQADLINQGNPFQEGPRSTLSTPPHSLWTQPRATARTSPMRTTWRPIRSRWVRRPE